MRKLLILLLGLCFITGALAKDKNSGMGATMEDYQWWRDARFGVFIHWGPGAFVYANSVNWTRFPEGRPHWNSLGYMADAKDTDQIPPEIYNGEYKKYAGRQVPPHIYNNLYRIFDPVKFDADEWAKTFKDAGAGYIIFTAKHHDGFCMWDCKYTDYDIMSTPFKRDICKELADACRKQGLRVMWYYSIVDFYDARYDVKNPKPYEEYFFNSIKELFSSYGPISGMFWDGGSIKFDRARIRDMMRELQPGCFYNGRGFGSNYGLAYLSPEQRLGSFNMETPWETCAVINDVKWIWSGGHNVKSVNMCLFMLINCVGGDGNLALNFGPTPEGEIYQPIKETYLGMGKWLKKYGESIYKTRGGPYKPGKWGVSTRRDKKIFLHVTQQWPIGVLTLPALPAKVTSCKTLTGGRPKYKQTEEGLEIRLDPKHHARPDTIIVLTLDKDAMEIEPIETMTGRHTLTTDAKVTASSSVKPGSNLGAPETVVLYSFETGKYVRHFGEEKSDDKAQLGLTGKREYTEEEIARLKKAIGKGHRGHFWRYWKPKEDDPAPWIEVDVGRPVTFQGVGLTELYSQVRGYEIQYHDGSDWKMFYSGDTINNLFVHLAKPITAQCVRLLITKTNGELPSITEFDLF